MTSSPKHSWLAERLAYLGMPRLVVLLLLPGPVFAFFGLGYFTTRDDFQIESASFIVLGTLFTIWSYRFAVKIAARLEEPMRKHYMIMVRTGQIAAPIAGFVLALVLFWLDS